MKKLFVYYNGWGEHWLLGTLADNGDELLFEYSPEALRQGLEMSPRHLMLRGQAYGGFPEYLQRLPGLIADSLPDGWGMLLMDRLFRKSGMMPAQLSSLDRLAFIGDRALGALSFEPENMLDLQEEDVKLLGLAKDVQAIIAGEDSIALRQLALMGGSPHGARPKVLVYYNTESGIMSTTPMANSQPWLVKFQAQNEHKEVCALEDLYAQLARNCGLDMPTTHYFDLDKNLAAFGIERFDVEDGMRVPVHTLAGALHANFRLPFSVDYSTFLRATRMFTRDEREVQKAYERAVFNIVFNNRDDHSKNFSFRLGRDRRWRLAPCYDLTFSEGPGGKHQMDVCGEGCDITRTKMLELAQQGGLDMTWSGDVISTIVEEAGQFRKLASTRKIRPVTIKLVELAIEANRKQLA
ncbi:type II toxin-antitoxin system HipA family toxin [Desulforhopalus sp. 52FAK]